MSINVNKLTPTLFLLFLFGHPIKADEKKTTCIDNCGPVCESQDIHNISTLRAARKLTMDVFSESSDSNCIGIFVEFPSKLREFRVLWAKLVIGRFEKPSLEMKFDIGGEENELYGEFCASEEALKDATVHLQYGSDLFYENGCGAQVNLKVDALLKAHNNAQKIDANKQKAGAI